jgi:competence protein ComGC
MKTIKVFFISILLLHFILYTYAQKAKVNSTQTTSTATLKIQKGKEDQNGNPTSIIQLIQNGRTTQLAVVAGEATLINKNEFKEMSIPTNAISACSSWWGGAGDYFYIIQSNKKIILYQGWQDESQEDEGYHWKKVKEINN